MVKCGKPSYSLYDCFFEYFANMFQASGSKLNGQLQGQNRPGNGKRFKIKQGRSKLKGHVGVDHLYGKVSQINSS